MEKSLIRSILLQRVKCVLYCRMHCVIVLSYNDALWNSQNRVSYLLKFSRVFVLIVTYSRSALINSLNAVGFLDQRIRKSLGGWEGHSIYLPLLTTCRLQCV